MASDPASSAKQEIEEIIVPEIEQLPFFFVDKPSNKTTRLLANSVNPGPVEGQNRWYEFSFKEPVFIQSILIEHSNYSEYSEFKFEIVDFNDREKSISGKSKSNTTSAIINTFAKLIRFKPPRDYFFQNRTIVSVSLFGFDLSKAGDFISYARRVEEIKDDAIDAISDRETIYAKKISEAELAVAKVAEATKDVQSLKGQAQRQRSNIQTLEISRNELTSKIEAMRQSISQDEVSLESLRIQISGKTSEREKLNSEISTLTANLAKLRANVDLFPAELESFVTQGRRNTQVLFWLAAIPICILLAMFVLLISGAVDLTTKIDPEGKINIAALIASRAPYVAVALTIITACYKITRYFMLEIVEINRQRLNLTKIGIIAKDVSNAAEIGLDLTDVERYGLRVRLKMELLKDHLKGYLSSNLDVQLPSTITDYHPFEAAPRGQNSPSAANGDQAGSSEIS